MPEEDYSFQGWTIGRSECRGTDSWAAEQTGARRLVYTHYSLMSDRCAGRSRIGWCAAEVWTHWGSPHTDEVYSTVWTNRKWCNTWLCLFVCFPRSEHYQRFISKAVPTGVFNSDHCKRVLIKYVFQASRYFSKCIFFCSVKKENHYSWHWSSTFARTVPR